MKIQDIRINNRKKVFEVETEAGMYPFPYALLRVAPDASNRVVEVFPDEELGFEGFTYRLEDGSEDSIHVDAVLEYNRDPAYLKDLLLHRLTLEAQKAVDSSDLSKRELMRTLGTSASQLYRLLDPTNQSKSVGQMLALLHVLGREIDVVISPREPPKRPKRSRRGKAAV
jgi:hypothetical protein